ncbi:methyltransferase domain-containing protein [Metapseudomonas lalkuanensis]|uniref:class I SAM-dependent methyltransferase n=1 Tax=Metapseudomonas lalkuanensis TaxID=2604832 RepID=UPI001CF1B891|nr:class I SAM-dependent methyltransferase [Pseudomonas lalkuanensis]UCO97924.1 methyltransferase domain-containing protein [Pseudomonas lalkuanensis]
MKIDLGCGKRKQDGFIGVDRFPMPEVDVIADIDERLPFADNSIDLLFSSHSLEHVRDLMSTMREIYRVCKHGAQVCIVAPYNEQKLNIANPYHIGVFNEHTPRFWTDYPETPVDRDDYPDPVPRPWGLSRSDNSNPGLDIRLVNMEFFYFPQYRNIPIEQQRKLRSEKFDVCEQIIYQLIVWKGDECCPDRSYADYLNDFVPYEPHYIRHLKMQEREELISKHKQERDQLLQTIVELQKQAPSSESTPAQAPRPEDRRMIELMDDRERMERALHDARTESHQLRMQIASMFERLETLSSQTHSTSALLVKAQSEIIEAGNSVLAISQENQELRKRIDGATNNRLDEVQSDILNLGGVLGTLTSEISTLRDRLENDSESHMTKTHSGLGEVQSDILNLGSVIGSLADEIAELRNRLESDSETHVSKARSEVHEASSVVISLGNENRELRAKLEAANKSNAKAALLKAELDAANGVIAWYRAKEGSWNSELNRLRDELSKAHELHAPWQQEASRLNGELHHTQQASSTYRAEAKMVIQSLYHELMDYRASHSIRIASMLKKEDALWNAVSPAFEPLKAFTLGNLRDASRTRLVLGDDLRSLPYREYRIPVDLGSLESISLAVRPLLKTSQGLIGIEVVSNDLQVVAQSVRPLAGVDPDVPTSFNLSEPITGLAKNWFLRVYVKDADIPVSLYEQAHYSIVRRKTKYLPFALLQ